MNTKVLQEKLLRVARANPPSDRVPLAFEQRIMALIRSRPPVDALALWVRALWKAAVPCVAVTILFLTWAVVEPSTSDNAVNASLNNQLESTLMASVTIESDLSW